MNLSTTIIDPPQIGQVEPDELLSGMVGGERAREPELSAIRRRHSGNRADRRRFANNPKKRMRTKPRGKTCSRKRRRNSSAARVINRLLFPWA